MLSAFSQLYYRLQPSWAIYQTLKESQFYSRQRLEQMQLAKLRILLDHAQSYPYWQARLGAVIGEDITALSDMQQFPILEKSDLDGILEGVDIDISKLMIKRSGGTGTDGAPAKIAVSPQHVAWSQAAMLRFYDWMQINLGARRAKVFAAPTMTGIPETTLKNRFRNLLSNSMFLDALDLTPRRIDEIIAALRQYHPQLIIGYTSCMLVIAQELIARGETLGVEDAVIMNAAEPLGAERREIIEAGFGNRIYDHYGTREVGFIADEVHPTSGLHVHMEYLLVEIVDEQGQWCRVGQEGDVLITQLENFAQPILRYRIGDRAVRTDAEGIGGRGLQVVPAIVGRSVDMILLPDGNRLTGLAFPHILKDFPVRNYQIVQKTSQDIDFNIVLDPMAQAAHRQELEHALRQLLPGLAVTVHYVPAIERTDSGKVRTIISEVVQGQNG